jgi:hypothetical protein
MSISSLGIALKVPPLGANKLDPVTAAYATNIATAGGSISAASLAANDQLVKGLKADGLWSLLHEIYTFSGDFPAALVKLKTVTGQAALINSGSVGFSAADFNEIAGLRGTANKYLKTGYVQSLHGLAGSVSLGAYCNDNATYSTGMMLFGAEHLTSGRLVLLFPRTGSGGINLSFVWDVGRLDPTMPLTGPGNTFGLISAHTVGSAFQTYSNGSLVSQSTQSSGVDPEIEFYMFANNDNGNDENHNNSRFSFGFVGAEMTPAQIISVHGHILTFQQEMSRA